MRLYRLQGYMSVTTYHLPRPQFVLPRYASVSNQSFTATFLVSETSPSAFSPGYVVPVRNQPRQAHPPSTL